MLSQLLAPLMNPLVGNAQLTGDLGNRLSAGLSEPYRLALKLMRVRLWTFCMIPVVSLE